MAHHVPWSLLVLVPFGILAAGCMAETSVADEQDATATQYVEATAFLTKQADKDAWAAMKARLDNEFYQVCGDTFCGGDYSNLTSMGLTCAVSSKVGQIHDCLWTFAGSSELVDPKVGTLQVSKPSFQCHFATTARALNLATALTSAVGENSALQMVLPGETTSIYDALGTCFQHPIGASPLTNTFSQTPSYSLAGDAPSTDGNWFGGAEALQSAFAADCASSFCQGTYKNLDAIRLSCAVGTVSDKVKSCAFILAGSNSTVSTTKGTVAVDFKSYRCSLPMTGTANDLTTVILGTGATPVLDRLLPGSTKTFRQAITTCL
jgi:hypothetical protein